MVMERALASSTKTMTSFLEGLGGSFGHLICSAIYGRSSRSSLYDQVERFRGERITEAGDWLIDAFTRGMAGSPGN